MENETLLIKILKAIAKTFLVIIAILLIIIGGIGALCGGLIVANGEFTGIIFLGIGLIIILIGISLTKSNNNKQNTTNQNTGDAQKLESDFSQNNSANIEK